MGNSRAEVDSNFEKQLKQIQLVAGQEAAARVTYATAQPWMMPTADAEVWDGNLLDLAGLGKPFSREKANSYFTQAISNKDQPGVDGDCVASVLQADYLALMERAFRARHASTRPRMVMHAMARRGGHGHAQGVFGSALEYVRGILRQAKANTQP